jgi:hypothetical protein
MAVPELLLAKIRRFVADLAPVHVRDQLHYEADVRGNNVTLVECRPPVEDGPAEWRMKIAQLRYQPDAQLWTLYWADRNDRWHRYDWLEPTVLDAVLREIEHDPMCVIFG